MKKYRGIIKNEENKVIFSRKGNFETADKCLEFLKQRVLIDIPSHHSFIMSFSHTIWGGESGFENTPYYLGRYYKDVSKLEYQVEELK
jgi:hypothetical protein